RARARLAGPKPIPIRSSAVPAGRAGAGALLVRSAMTAVGSAELLARRIFPAQTAGKRRPFSLSVVSAGVIIVTGQAPPAASSTKIDAFGRRDGAASESNVACRPPSPVSAVGDDPHLVELENVLGAALRRRRQHDRHDGDLELAATPQRALQGRGD